MTDGQSYGKHLRGDLDQWSFNANKDDDIRVSISEEGGNTAFVPMFQLIGPDGSNYGYSWGDLSAQRHITAAATGAYTVVVSRNDYADGPGAYFLTFSKSPGTFVVPIGDQGGAMNNGQNYAGSILRGDLDQWSFNANKGDDVTVSISEAGVNTAFVPMIQIVGPDGTDFGFSWSDLFTAATSQPTNRERTPSSSPATTMPTERATTCSTWPVHQRPLSCRSATRRSDEPWADLLRDYPSRRPGSMELQCGKKEPSLK